MRIRALGRRAPRRYASWAALLAALWGLPSACTENVVQISPERAPGERDGRLNVILVVMDALRADRLSLYGNPRRTSPYMDGLARNALVFERAYSQAPWTAPSVASIFTGTYQSVHQVTHRFDQDREFSVLEGEFVTLAEAFHAAGYRTAAFSSQAWILPETGFAQGFEEFGVVSSISDRYETDRVVRAGIGWVARHRREPFFLYLHVLNPHSPYDPPPPFDRMWWRGPVPPTMRKLAALGIDEQWEFLIRLGRPGHAPVAREDLDYLFAMYDGEITYVDWWIGALARQLGTWGLLHDTLIVLTSDHGESFQEHGIFGHAQHVYNPELAIPLILSNPRLFPRQRRVQRPVESIDLFPTLAELVGLERPEHLQGKSLLAEPEGPSPAYSEGTNLKNLKLQDGTWSLIADRNLERFELYRLDEDPGETVDVYAAHRDVADRLAETLIRRYRENLAHPWRTRGTTTDLDPGVVERLRAMGYVQ